jgi:hypothetical protein
MENGMALEPIEVTMATPHQKLDKMSRLNFLKPYSVEHNVKAMDMGFVSPRSMPYLLAYWQSAINDPGDMATQEYAPSSRSARGATESTTSGRRTTDESISRTVDKQSGTKTGPPFPLPEPALPESPDMAFKVGQWTKSSSGRMYRSLTFGGKIYTQWDNDEGFVTASGPVVSTPGSKPGNGPKRLGPDGRWL